MKHDNNWNARMKGTFNRSHSYRSNRKYCFCYDELQKYWPFLEIYSCTPPRIYDS